MGKLTLNDRIKSVARSADRTRRSALSRMQASPLLRWRYQAAADHEIRLIPTDLRPLDTSFAGELELGHMTLAGVCREIDPENLFQASGAPLEWRRELLGFGWLRNLDLPGSPEAHEVARGLVRQWLATRGRQEPVEALRPQLIARRLLSWLAHAPVLLECEDAAFFDSVMTAIERQRLELAATWPCAPDGPPRLICLIALIELDLCRGGEPVHFDTMLPQFDAELCHQVISPSGPISRNPDDCVELLLDLLPLSECFAARDLDIPERLAQSLDTLQRSLRHMRLGDGGLARFNGAGTLTPSETATAASFCDWMGMPKPAPVELRNGYARIAAGDSVLLMDSAAAPPIANAHHAQAGCLSFEWSFGTELVLSNCGWPGAHADHRDCLHARATASHNTLRISEKSSARIMSDSDSERLFGSPPLSGPPRVTLENLPDEMGAPGSNEAHDHVVRASHNGYVELNDLLHTRELALSPDGCRVTGLDRICGGHRDVRLGADLPFTIHFHLAPGIDVSGERRASLTVLVLRTPDGRRITFEAEGAQIALEDSLYRAVPGQPLLRRQIVLRGATFGETEVKWAFTVDPL